ncbi:MAG: hypothetical protein ACOYN0_16160 [Phycisphaerales bacterium]
MCERTSCKCKCNGKDGFIYDCKGLGLLCLPVNEPKVKATISRPVGACTVDSCDDTEGLEYRMIVNKKHIIGSTRARCLDAGCADPDCGGEAARGGAGSPARIVCVNTGVACKDDGVPGSYWKCGDKLVCVPKTERMATKVEFGQSIKVDATEATITFIDADGSISTQVTHALGDGLVRQPLSVLTPTGPRINCRPTTTKCKCNGKDGYIYDCGHSGYKCIPTAEDPPKAKTIVKVMELNSTCLRTSCDKSGYPQAYYLVDGWDIVIGSDRPAPSAGTPRGGEKASKSKPRQRKS